MKSIFMIIFILSGFVLAQNNGAFYNGVDLSFIPQVENNGGVFSSVGTPEDPLNIFKDNAVNYVRLRLWHTPQGRYSGLDTTLKFAQRVKQAGFKLLLDFHYSDSWADPGKQYKPAAWNNLPYENLSDSVYSYTFRVIKAFDDLGILPEMVQVGNEITPGFLWPDGRVGGSYDTPQQWTNFTNLLKRAVSAVHDAASDTVKIVLHIDRGGNNSSSRWWYDNITKYNVPFDVIGLSFYPWWHGTLTDLRRNVNDLALRYGKEIVVAETAYPWTLQWYDNTGNIVGQDDPLHQGYPASVEGQYSFLYDLIQIIKEVPNKKGTGIFYWEPAWISAPTFGSSWENLALFNFQGDVLSSIRVFKETNVDTSNAINVTFTLNTSTNPDTLSESGFVQLRGEITDGADILASGEELTWDINSEVVLQNVRGDYWQATVRVPAGKQIQYKYWTGHSKNKATYLRLGNEGPIEPFDSSGGNVRKFTAGLTDTILQVEYYNPFGNTMPQYWMPFESKTDSIAVYFKVNMRGITASGRFNPSVNGPAGIRGENLNSLNILSWDKTTALQREALSVSSGSFWSGVVYFPKSLSGIEQQYKFFIENDTDNGWENSIPNRRFNIPFNDTTINWVYFDDNNFVTSVENEENVVQEYRLMQNYPNPFNNSTVVQFEMRQSGHISVRVYNMLGERVNTLLDDFKESGSYNLTWNGKDNTGSDLPSGMYFIRMNAGSYNNSIKTILLK